MKKWLWPLVLFFVLAVVVYSTRIIPQAIVWVSALALNTYTGNSFHYESVQWDGDQLVFENPAITSPAQVKASLLTITPKIDFSDRILNLDIRIHKPHCQLLASDEKKLIDDLTIFQNPWIHSSIKVTEGTLCWDSADRIETINCCFHVCPRSKSPNLTAQFHAASLEGVLRLLEEKFPSLCHLKSSSGTLDGNLSITFQEHRPPHLQGKFLLSNAVLSSDQYPLPGAIDRLEVECALPHTFRAHFIPKNGENSAFSATYESGQMELNCRHLCANEGQFLLNFLQTFHPLPFFCVWEKGHLNSVIRVATKDGEIEEFAIPAFSGSHLEFQFPERNFSFYIPQVHGCCGAQTCDPDWLEHMDAVLEVVNASIHIPQLASPTFSNINTRLEMHRGQIPQSRIKLELGNLKGLVDLKWNKENHQFTLNLDGQMTDLAEFMPPAQRTIFLKNFQKHRFAATLTAEGTEIKGVAFFGDKNQSNKEIIHFGGSLIAPFKGWFYTPKLPVEKYISPFMFDSGAAEIKGLAEIQGAFNSETLEIKYEADQLILENQHLRMERLSPFSKSQRQFSGYYCLNWSDLSFTGHLPIQNATYLEKKTGLFFTNICSQAYFEKGMIHLNDLEAICEGISFLGNGDLDYRDPAPGVFDVHFDIPQFEGTIEQIQKFLSHLDCPESFKKLPLTGKVIARSDGAIVDFSFRPDNDSSKGFLNASLMNGCADFPSVHLALRDLSADINYDHEKKDLNCLDFQGACLVGKGERLAEYLISDSHLNFTDIDSNEFDLDVHFFEGSKEKARIKGNARLNDDHLIEFQFDRQKTHIASIQPDIFSLFLSEEGEIDQLDLHLKFQLNPFMQYLYQFNGLDWFIFSKQMIKKARQIELGGGEFYFDVHFENGVFHYDVAGKQLYSQALQFENFQLIGKKEDRKWIIEDLILDQLQLSAEIIPQDELWKIQFLGLKYQDNLLLGLDGIWDDDANRLQTHIHLFEYNLEQENFTEDWFNGLTCPGKLCGEGTLDIMLMPFAPWLQIQSNLHLRIGDLFFGDSVFSPRKPFQAQFQSGSALILNDLDFTFTRPGAAPGRLSCSRFVLQPDSKEWMAKMELEVPAHSSEKYAKLLQEHFSDYFSVDDCRDLAQVKKKGKLNAAVEIQKKEDQFFSTIKLADGEYFLNGKDYFLCDAFMEWLPGKFIFASQTSIERCPVFIQGQFNWPELNCGETIITDLSLSNQTVPLHMKWLKQAKKFDLQSISGSCAGITCRLDRAPLSFLKGTIQVDFERAKMIMTPEMIENIDKLGIDSTYRFEGEWDLQGPNENSIMDNLYFKGICNGTKTSLKGYEVEKMEANITYTPLLVRIEEAQFKDPAGIIQCDRCIMNRAHLSSPWTIWIPQIAIKNFRPTLLKEIGEESRLPGKARSLLVQSIELNDFNGELGNVNTWQASGQLYFCNPSRNNCPYPLFTIPSELILRLGLDPHVLNPVSGSIYFDLCGDRFYLNKFKDMYSEGRGSKFYLDEQTGPSWMDLDGRLNVHVRMRQDNLLFKIVEPFSVSIQGTITKPKYNLQKIRSSKRAAGRKNKFMY